MGKLATGRPMTYQDLRTVSEPKTLTIKYIVVLVLSILVTKKIIQKYYQVAILEDYLQINETIL